MSKILRHSNTCQIKQDSSGKIIEAVVHEFRDRERLLVILNQSVKLSLVWNGKVYEGRMAGLDFTSSGPDVVRSQTSSRG